MQTFEFYFGVSLGVLLMSLSDNLSKTPQHTFISAVEAQEISTMTVKTLQMMRYDEQFDLFWTIVNHKASDLGIAEPTLPRKLKGLPGTKLAMLIQNTLIQRRPFTKYICDGKKS